MKILTNDNQEFEIPFEIAKKSSLLSFILPEDDQDVIPLPNVDSKTLAKLLEFSLKDPSQIHEILTYISF